MFNLLFQRGLSEMHCRLHDTREDRVAKVSALDAFAGTWNGSEVQLVSEDHIYSPHF